LGTGDRPALVFDEALKQLRSEATVVVFEDLHWADEATLDIVRFLGRRLADGQTMFVCTYRDDELGPSHPLRVALGDLSGSPGVHRIALPPLTAAAVRELADGTEFDPVSLHTLTAGNPFFVAEVLAAAEDGIPATVRDAVFARLARLSDLGRRAMEVAAVFGDRVDLGRLLHGLGVEDDAIAECVASGMLIPSYIGVDFRHQLVRKAVLDSIAPSTRAELHSKVLVSARRRGIMPDELAELAEHAEFARGFRRGTRVRSGSRTVG
jgi:predicted ATPase